jgi:hypothetical protein
VCNDLLAVQQAASTEKHMVVNRRKTQLALLLLLLLLLHLTHCWLSLCSHAQVVSFEMTQLPLLQTALASPVALAVQFDSQMLPCTELEQLLFQARVRFCAGGKPGQVLTAGADETVEGCQ